MPRTPPAVKVHLSVDYHPRTSEIWADPLRRGYLVEIWRLAYGRFAAKRGDRLPLRAEDRLQITGIPDQGEADRVLRALFKELGYPCRSFKNRWEVNVRNFAKNQGVNPKESDPSTDENLSDREMHRENEKRNAEGRERDARERGASSAIAQVVASSSAPFRQGATPSSPPRRAIRAKSSEETKESERIVMEERERNRRIAAEGAKG